MRRKLLLVLCLWLAFAASAHADSGLSPDEIKQALAATDITIADYTLDGEDLAAFYKARDYAPVWNFAGPENNAAFLAYLDSISKTIAYHGLQPDDYALDLMRNIAAANAHDSALHLELLVTDTLLRLAHDLHGDDAELDQLYPGWNFHRDDIDIPGELAHAVDANSVTAFFDSLTVKNASYRVLARALGAYRAIAVTGGWNHIDPGPKLVPGDRGPRVKQLRARLKAEGYLPAAATARNGDFFDKDLLEAVKAYQLRNGFDADGHAGPETLEALNTPLATRIEQIRANMERWRHMPEDFPPARAVIVNIADATVDIVEDGRSIYHGIVIVGKVDRKTPFIHSIIRSMIVNPAWHVPTKIARADILPKLRKDPHYLEKLGIVIPDSEDDPHGRDIDWKHMSDEEFDFQLRQEPGKLNSLGRLKFDFENDFAVYLHGTPHQELFKKDQRMLSSGCVRLRDPEMVAQILLTGTPGDWDIPHIEKEIATRKTRWVSLKNPMPIYIVYWTVFADGDGPMQFRDDVYGYDKFLMESLKSTSEASELTKKSASDH